MNKATSIENHDDSHKCKVEFQHIADSLKKELLETSKALETRITLLESHNASLHQQLLDIKIESTVAKSSTSDVVIKDLSHIKNVQQEHISKLKGYNKRYIAKGNGVVPLF